MKGLARLALDERRARVLDARAAAQYTTDGFKDHLDALKFAPEDNLD